MIELHQHAFLRLKQIIGDRKATPPIQPLVPVSASSWWQGVRDGRFPQPLKLGPKTTVWRASEIAAISGIEPATAGRHRASQLNPEEAG